MNRAQRNLDVPIDYPVCRNVWEYQTLTESLTNIGYEKRGTFRSEKDLTFLTATEGVEISALPHLDIKNQTLSQTEFDFFVRKYNK